MNGEIVHEPVLLEEVLELLAPPAGPSLAVDATLGEGGHAEAFLSRFDQLSLVGVEVDEMVAEVALRRLARFGERFRLWRGWYSDFFERYEDVGEGRPDRVLFDLGISTFHIRASGRGFSFDRDEPLDMRLDADQPTTAADLVRGSTERELADLFFRLGEERFSRRIARRIVESRRREPIERTRQLAELIRRAVPPNARHGRIHPATRCFQALRIAVNAELDRLGAALDRVLQVLAPAGRVGVIAFHSLEDRIAKRALRAAAEEGPMRVLTRKPVRPAPEEVQRNPAARSARLRVAEKGEEA